MATQHPWATPEQFMLHEETARSLAYLLVDTGAYEEATPSVDIPGGYAIVAYRTVNGQRIGRTLRRLGEIAAALRDARQGRSAPLGALEGPVKAR